MYMSKQVYRESLHQNVLTITLESYTGIGLRGRYMCREHSNLLTISGLGEG